MNRFSLLPILILLSVSVFAQNKDTANISISNYSLHPGTYSWRGTNTFQDMTSWNSSPYQQGHLRFNNQFRMNYRLLPPVGYDANYGPGYPMIVMLHGGGERGNCWGTPTTSNCYCSFLNQNNIRNPCNANGTPIPGTSANFLNNDHNLLHGGSQHLAAVNLAGNKKAEDPTLNPRAFPGFVFFPQMQNSWKGGGAGASDLSMAIRTIRLLIKQYNIDPDRIYIHGLSFGGQAVMEAMNYADWLFAAAAPMSALVAGQSVEFDSVRNIPMWFFQGGQDGEPTPSQTNIQFVRPLRQRGANIRYTEYPNLGHGVWNTAYAEPDFFSWFLSKRKSDIHVDFDNPNICGTNGKGASLVLAQGFPAYQWERDGQIIPGATSHTYVATIPGVYRARFSRKSANPTEQEWNRWSNPVYVGENTPERPVVTHEGTLILSDLNRNAAVKVQGPPGYETYTWRYNGGAVPAGTVFSDGEPHRFELRGPTGASQFQKNGAYTLVVAGFDECPSLPSEPKYVMWGTHNYQPPEIANAPTNLTWEPVSPTSVLFKWTDNSTDERSFELWRRKLLNVPNENFETGWVLAAQTGEDETVFLETGLEANSTYYYKLRAVNDFGRSMYCPGNSHQDNPNSGPHILIVTTGSPATPPKPPGNLVAQTVSENSIKLTWDPPLNAPEISEYVITNNGNSFETNSKATEYTVSSLVLNTVYTFTVQAKYADGSLSEPSNPAVAHTYVEGLFYKHSTGAWSDLDEPSLQATFINPEFTGWVPTFTLNPRTQEDFFNFEFSGYFYVPNNARYRFRVGSDDGSRLFIGPLTLDNDGLHGLAWKESAEVIWNAGPVPIKVWFFERDGGQDLRVEYCTRNSSSDAWSNWTPIPASLLRSGTPPSAPTPPAPPTNLSANATGMAAIDLNWDYPDKHIVVLGSSTAEGTGANPIGTNSWVNRLAAWPNGSATVTNLALGGFDTYDVLPGGDPARNITYALSLNPDIIIVNLPSNDEANNIPAQETIANLQTIYNLANNAGVKMFITTTQPRNFANATKRENLYTVANTIRSTFGEWAIDIYEGLTDMGTYMIKDGYGSGDGVHLNNTGHEYIYNTVREKLKQYLPSFEIQRGGAISGPFATVEKVYGTQFHDTGLVPNTTYFYRVRTNSTNAVSSFTTVVNATTQSDNVAPTQPGAPTLLSKSYSVVNFQWTPVSTDNVGLKGYNVYQNGQYIGFTQVNAFSATDLEPGVQYTFNVRAVDLNDNLSSPSANLIETTNVGQTFTTKPGATALNELASWQNGNGQSPTSFNHNGQTFRVQHGAPVTSPWSVGGSVSKVEIDNNVTVTIGSSPIYGKVEIPGNGVLNIGNAQIPEFGTLSPTSTVNYTYKFIKQGDYGNLSLGTSGAFTFPTGTTRVRGNLIAANGSSVKGTAGNGSAIELFGNLTVNGTPEELAPGFGVDLQLAGNGNQNITLNGGALDLFKLSKTGSGNFALVGNGGPVTLNLGSTAGGGLSIPNGSTFNLGNNELAIAWAGTINGANETGQIAVNGGTLNITSTSGTNSNLRFSSGANTLHTLAQNLTGSGTVQVHNAVNITDAVKITDGDLYSNGNITLLSTENKTAHLQQIENDGRVYGAMNVQRYMSSKSRVYRYISSSVEGVTIADWQEHFPITGNFPQTSTGAGLTTQPSLFVFGTAGWQAYPDANSPVPYNNAAAPIERGRGYAAFVRNTGSVTMETSGVPYQGTIPFSVFPPQGGDPENDWNLLGNPYASTISWSNDTQGWTKAGVSSVIAVRNNFNTSSGQFEYYDAATGLGTGVGGTLVGGRIAPGQAFWVQAVLPNAAVTINERAKVNDQQELYRESAPKISHLRIKLNQGDKADAALVIIRGEGTDNYDKEIDGLKMANEGLFSLSTVAADDHTLAINNLGDAFCSKTVGLNIAGTSPGNYALSFDSPETLFGVGRITLKDKFTNTTVDVNASTSYPFTVTSDPASSGKARFELILDRPELNTDITTQLDISCGEAPQITLSNTTAGVTYAVYRGDVALTSEYTSVGDDLQLAIPLAALEHGENKFSVKAAFKGCSAEMIPDVAVFHHYSQPTIQPQAVSVCEGSAATLTATVTGDGLTYQWFDDNGAIKGATGPVYETETIFFDKDYYVRAIDPNGCAGPRTLITVSPELLEIPEIVFTSDTMSTVALAQEYIWSQNGETVYRSLTDPRFTPTADGSYTLTVRKGGCLRTSREQVVTGVERESFSSFQLYPNPTTSRNIKLRFAGAGNDVVVRIVDVVGKEVFTMPYENLGQSGELQIEPMQRLAKGVYLMTIEYRSGKQQIRFVIEE